MKNHYERISIANGGVVEKCWECKTLTLCRFVTEVRNMAPQCEDSWQDNHTYRLCDECADAEKEIFETAGAEVFDGRTPF